MNDHNCPCQPLQDCQEDVHARLINIENELMELKGMKEDVATMAEILSAWNNSKGFVTTVKILGKTAIFIVVMAGAITAIINWKGS